ncbi:MAG: hypothetical protein ACRD96_03370, partial [Bryobacteraceae bacterium]
WWNGALSADLRAGAGHNTHVVFRAGRDAEMYGLRGDAYSRIGYEDGYLPIVRSAYTREGVRYEQTAFVDRSGLARAGFQLTNTTGRPLAAELHADVILLDGRPVSVDANRVLDPEGAVLLIHSGRAAFEKGRLTFRIPLASGGSAAIRFSLPYSPSRRVDARDFDAALEATRRFWRELLLRGARFEVPERRVNDTWRALLLQNFILADGARFTYGSGLRYNDSYYPVESGFGAHVFSQYGHTGYGSALLPWSVPVSVQAKLAARKYQNRRGLPFHHILENWRYSRDISTFERYRDDLYRVAEEIIADRRSTMTPDRPLHWGLLPPDKPGVDLRAATQTVYVVAHNITSCQGLQDFGEFLTRTGIDRERGRRYLAEAAEYRKTILDAMERAAIRVPGRPPFVDLQTLYFRDTPEFGPEPYDHLALGRVQGVYYHYWADMQYMLHFFNPSDAVAQWIADYVAERGGFVLGMTQARRRPELPYGWINAVYNAGYYDFRLRSGRRNEFLLGFYSRLAFAHSRHVLASSEGAAFIGYNTRNGGWIGPNDFFPNSAANSETLALLRQMLVYEELESNIETGRIHLMAGVPAAWLEPGKRIRVERAPTFFGEIGYEAQAVDDAV